MSLTDLAVRKAAPKEKRYMLADERGLYLEVLPTGKKSWRFRYQENGKEKKITLGSYPDFSLLEARNKLDEARKRLAHGEPVVEIKKRNFRAIAEEWMDTQVIPIRSPRHIKPLKLRLDKYVYPAIGHKFCDDIIPQDVLAICRRIEGMGAKETAHRVKQLIGQIIRYAIAISEATTDPTYSLRGALRPYKSNHYAAITEPTKIAELVRAISVYPRPILRCAMLFSMLTFMRPGEIRYAEWTEIDWDKEEWRIPADKMKMKRAHIVSLSKQAMTVLEELKSATGWQNWLFPSARMDGRAMSENGVRIALRSMGYTNDEMTAHGFRAMASTILNENSFSPDVIERQLAHAPGNKIRAAYNHAEYLPERRKMMQWWADWLDGLISKG